MSPQVSPYASVFSNVPQTKSRYLNPRAKSQIERLQGLIDFKRVTGRDYSAEQAQLDELLRSQPVPENVAPEARPPNQPFLREPTAEGPPADVAPDATATETPAPTGTTDQVSGLPEFQRGTPPAFLQELLSRLGGGTSPEVQEAIDLRRSLMEEGLPAPIDLGQFIQAAEQRQLEAKEEAKRMALANVLTSLGAGLLEGDAAAGLQQATKLAEETLREGRREARAEGQVAEQLRLQAAQQERQNIIDTMKFKSESVDAIASLISGEKKADLTNSLQAAQLLVQFENNQDNLEMELRKQGFSDEKVKKEKEKAALQSATRIVESLISSGQLEVKNASEAGIIIKRLANQFTGTYGEEDLSSDNVMNYSDLAKQNQ